ncbi:MAG: flavin reductase [Clostridiales bacterium]|jgi:flavin reductase (DIM6/NTAB) family NADH-FMN oxidoreductase RutF|nr:flavin reductase [Clostridiales bacterium]
MITQKQIDKTERALIEQGLFVTCGNKTPNLMSTHWGGFGYFFNRWLFILPVRNNKLSHEIIEQTQEFGVSVPYKDLRDAIVKTDITSGRTHNKFVELHLHPIKAKKIDTYLIGDCGLHIECKVIHTSNIARNNISQHLNEQMYHNKDYHTMYYGEIVDIYETE